ncbi:MAG TPA: response regulator [Pseudomonas sp.]|nr:response regulator [Pseudomonas sp.]
MQNPHLSILVVDDTKFSSALIGRALSQAGYHDVRFADSAGEALRQLAQRPAGILLADWLMPEVDGLELTARVRRQDEHTDHYTYIMLLTGREGESDLGEAFTRGVDDFISKARIHDQLIPRVLAGDRLSQTLQRLLRENRQLSLGLGAGETSPLIDPLTGLGNGQGLRHKLAECLRTLESGDSAFCLLLIGLPQLPQVLAQRGEAAHRELLGGVARHLQQLVRPRDVLTRLDDGHFALIALLERLEDSAVLSFTRLADSLNRQPFGSGDGQLKLHADIALLGVDTRSLPQTPEHLIEQARDLLAEGGEGAMRVRQLG